MDKEGWVVAVRTIRMRPNYFSFPMVPIPKFDSMPLPKSDLFIKGRNFFKKTNKREKKKNRKIKGLASTNSAHTYDSKK
jgi:hypothetical protein